MGPQPALHQSPELAKRDGKLRIHVIAIAPSQPVAKNLSSRLPGDRRTEQSRSATGTGGMLRFSLQQCCSNIVPSMEKSSQKPDASVPGNAEASGGIMTILVLQCIPQTACPMNKKVVHELTRHQADFAVLRRTMSQFSLAATQTQRMVGTIRADARLLTGRNVMIQPAPMRPVSGQTTIFR